ncbi:helix-turn-helix domain-containing protein [Saccharothrix luteola]|uniref:helix-turn-helix domain-containing protein n=1 Tax=Saccharothrix luteola TaxID=2893018 RepID=UPI0035579062
MRHSEEKARDGFVRHGEHEPLYQVSEVAELLRVSKQTVYRAISDGELPAVRIRSRKLVPKSAVTAVLQRATTASETSPNMFGLEDAPAPTTKSVTK